MFCLEDPRGRAAPIAVVLLGSAALVGLRLVRTWATYGGDSVHYYMQVRSLVVDRDLDLSDEFARLHEEVSVYTGNRKLPEIPPTRPVTGPPATFFPVSTAIRLGALGLVAWSSSQCSERETSC